MATSRSASALISDDLPTFGRPVIDEHQALAQPFAAPSVVQVGRHFASQGCQFTQHLRLDLRRKVLVREVDQCLLLCQQKTQPLCPAAI